MKMEVEKWADVAEQVKQLNPDIYANLAKLEGVDDFPVVRVSYRFGDRIIEKGRFQIHDGVSCQPFEKIATKAVQKLLDYSWQSVPFGMVLKGSCESHSEYGDTVLPYRLKMPGKTFSLLTVFENPFVMPSLWTETAGCRSLFTLPKITAQSSLDILRDKYEIEIGDTKDFGSHWQFFKNLARSDHFDTDWEVELLLFTKPFIKGIEKNTEVREALLQTVWGSMSFMMNSRNYNFLWSILLSQLQAQNAVPNAVLQDPLIVETAKNIVQIACQAAPGFRPAVCNTPGPIEDFTRVLVDDYKIRSNFPTFMHIGRFEKKEPVYYTMSHHTFVHAHPQAKNYNRETVTDMMYLREILLRFRHFILSSGSGHDLTKTLLCKHLKNVDFQFFHPKGKLGISNNINQIFDLDPRFMPLSERLNLSKKLGPATTSLFFNGCVRIA